MFIIPRSARGEPWDIEDRLSLESGQRARGPKKWFSSARSVGKSEKAVQLRFIRARARSVGRSEKAVQPVQPVQPHCASRYRVMTERSVERSQNARQKHIHVACTRVGNRFVDGDVTNVIVR